MFVTMIPVLLLVVVQTVTRLVVPSLHFIDQLLDIAREVGGVALISLSERIQRLDLVMLILHTVILRVRVVIVMALRDGRLRVDYAPFHLSFLQS